MAFLGIGEMEVAPRMEQANKTGGGCPTRMLGGRRYDLSYNHRVGEGEDEPSRGSEIKELRPEY